MLTVAHPDQPLGLTAHDGVVGDEHEGQALLVELTHERHHFLGALRVERTGGLVGPDHAGMAGERPRDRDPLLLAARELVGPVPGAMPEADTLERLDRPPTRASAARTPARSSGISTFSTALRTGIRLNCWNTKPIDVARRCVRVGVAELVERLAVEDDATGVDVVERRQAVQQRRLSGT